MRCEGGVLEFFFKFQAYSFGPSGGHEKFQNHSFTPSRLFIKFTPKYSTMRGEGGVLDFFLSSRLILLVIQEVMQNFKIVALLLLGYS